jgi:signal transduction histidine kinase
MVGEGMDMTVSTGTLGSARTADGTKSVNRGAALGAGAIVLLGVAATVAFFTLNAANGMRGPVGGSVLLTIGFTAFSLVGGLIAARLPRNATGWLMLAVGAGAMVMNAAQQYAKYGLETDPGSLPGALAVAWVSNWGYYAALANVFFLLLLFPTGHPASRFWRVVLWIDVALVLVVVSSLAFGPRPLEGLDVPNPFRIVSLAPVLRAIDQGGAAGVMLFVVLLTCLASPVLRARRASGVERQQLKWLALGASIFAVCFGVINPLLSALVDLDIGYLTWGIGLVALPMTMGVAIAGYRLYELSLVINRSLVYFILTAGMVAVYVGLVALLQGPINRSGGALIATGIVVVAFQPLHRITQRAINRLMYGERDEPYAVLSRLSMRLASSLPAEQTLTTITETLTSALKIPYAAIELRRDHGYLPGAVEGEPREVAMTLPLIHRGEEVGRLLVSARSPGSAFSSADRRLLEDLARQAGAVAYGVRLLAELQRARERLVVALEEERRRIRRDLHDGIGPSLAGLSLQIEAARNLIASDPDRASALLDTLTRRTQSAIADVRQLVYGLRPPALDELGLVGALSEQASRFEAGNSIQISIEAQGDLNGLPAATEVAGYRIVLEAITNAARHSKARRCGILLRRTDELTVEVRDDGLGLPEGFRWGVGMASMRERAEELGGALSITSAPAAGTLVRATLPVMSA